MTRFLLLFSLLFLGCEQDRLRSKPTIQKETAQQEQTSNRFKITRDAYGVNGDARVESYLVIDTKTQKEFILIGSRNRYSLKYDDIELFELRSKE